MAVDRHRFPRAPHRRRAAAPALLACGVMVLAGCASMPGSGDVSRVDSSLRSEDDSQVQVYGVSPAKGEQPSGLVSGFLEATTSDEETFATAREYLSPAVASKWDPFASMTVLADAPDLATRRDRDGEGVTVEVTGTQLGTVDAHHAYAPGEKPFKQRIHVSKSQGQWRIDEPPPGLIITEADFQRLYRSVNKYYFAELGPDAGRSRLDDAVLVADPVYLRQRIDPVGTSVRALLDGPTSWLDPVVRTAFPRGTELRGANRPTLDDSDELQVRLSRQAAGVDGSRCRQMAAQVLFTVQDQMTNQLSGVRLERSDGSELCSLSRDVAVGYRPDNGSRGHQYFIDEAHRMVRLADRDEKARPVPGPFGDDGAQLGSLAVARDERLAAGVSRDGTELYVAELREGADRGPARLRSRAADPGQRLSTPTWDGLGGLWVADRDPRRPRLLRLRDGIGEPEPVRVSGLGEGRIEELRVAADGMRVALLVRDKGHTRLLLGRIERDRAPEGLQLSVEGLRAIAPKLEDVDAVSWAGGSRLVVAGRESQGVQQLQYVETDGSHADVPSPPTPNRADALAATEDPARPLLAKSMDGIVRLPPNGDWKTVAKVGTAPAYPG
ncbi:LpqB family beta-propeller domain-containing protein [Streptomyces pactum]|uniref:LpqB family beta-propeller domain-containing protein n=1 Tax=Streptomyces pactum TaxID=68249 RepID=UPI0027DC1CAF|nr:LpqB family beta-propeller domain-containing protein [Streptomyces pactum]